MKTLKQFFAVIIMMGSLSVGYANGGDSGYTAPTFSDGFGLQATVVNNKVELNWNRFDSLSSETLRYYKIVRSASNSSPVYPDDGYIQYSSEPGFTAYTDEKPLKGTAYYRVCAITEKNNRVCSNVAKVFSEGTADTAMKKEEYVKKEEVKKNDVGLNTNIKKQLDTILEAFNKKLKDSEKTDAEKLAIVNTVIDRLATLKTQKPQLSAVIEYLYRELRALATSYQIPSDLDGIFEIN